MDNQIENQVEVQPKNQKSGKGKTIAIIILVLLVLGLGGYIAYDKVLNNEVKNYKAEIKQLKKENKSLIKNNKNLTTENEKLKVENSNVQSQNNTTNTQIDNISAMAGKYYAKKTINGDVVCTYTASLNLKEDGTYTYESGCDCGGGYVMNGKYKIETDKIHLHDDNSNSDFEISNSNGTLVTTKTCGGVKLEMIKQ